MIVSLLIRFERLIVCRFARFFLAAAFVSGAVIPVCVLGASHASAQAGHTASLSGDRAYGALCGVGSLVVFACVVWVFWRSRRALNRDRAYFVPVVAGLVLSALVAIGPFHEVRTGALLSMACYTAAQLVFVGVVWALWQSRKSQNRGRAYAAGLSGLVLCGLLRVGPRWVDASSQTVAAPAPPANGAHAHFNLAP